MLCSVHFFRNSELCPYKSTSRTLTHHWACHWDWVIVIFVSQSQGHLAGVRYGQPKVSLLLHQSIIKVYCISFIFSLLTKLIALPLLQLITSRLNIFCYKIANFNKIDIIDIVLYFVISHK